MEASFTVYFDPPYWVGIVEILDNNTISVARHVFGVEPTEPELLEFAKKDYRNLSFSRPVPCEIQNIKKVNFKRKMHDIRRQMAERPDSTRSQDAVRQDYEARTRDQRLSEKEERSAELERRYRLKKNRRAEKHRGH